VSTSSGANIPIDGLVLGLDFANKQSFSSNLYPTPTDLFSRITSGSRITGSRGFIQSPVGNSPLQMTQVTDGGGSRGYTSSYNSAVHNFAPALAGETWTVSFWAKSSVQRAGTGAVYIFGANSSGVAFVDGAWLNIFSLATALTTEWKRFSITSTFTNPDVRFIHMRMDVFQDALVGDVYWFDGLQVEKSPSPTTFNPNYFGTTSKNIINRSQELNEFNSQFISYRDSGVQITRSASTPKLGGRLAATMSGELTSQNFLYRNHSWEILFRIDDRFPGNYDVNEGFSLLCAYRGFHSGFIYGSTSVFYSLWNGSTNVLIGSISLGTSGTSIVQGQWAHLCATKNETGVKIYLNGNLVTNYTGTFAINAGVTNELGFGAAQSNTDLNFSYFSKMTLAQSKMYNRELTAQEVQKNFNALRGRYGI